MVTLAGPPVERLHPGTNIMQQIAIAIERRNDIGASDPEYHTCTMTREESWEVEGTTLTLLRHVSSLGYAVSVFRFPGSLLGTRAAAVEMHAVDVATNPPTQHVARMVEGETDPEYRCAALLAQMVGIELEDG